MDQQTDELIEAPAHICDICQRNFKTQSALTSHKKFHAKSNPGQSDLLVQEYLAAAEPETPRLPPEHAPGPRFDTIPEQGMVYIRKLPNYGNLPDITRATPGSAGYDLYAAIDQSRCLRVGERLPFPTGIAIEMPPSLVAKVVPRSGLALTNGITVLNTPGIIDSDFRGEIKVILINQSNTKFWVEPGMRIAQMLFTPVVTPDIVFRDSLTVTSRGSGGFGSSGV